MSKRVKVGPDGALLSQEDDPARPRIQVIVGIPAAFITQTRFWAHLLSGWLSSVSLSVIVSEGNQIVLNRSEIIAHTRRVYEKVESDDIGPPLLMLDTDVIPRVSLIRALETYVEDQAKGFDMVLSPTMKYLGSLAGTDKNPLMVMADPEAGAPITGRESGAFPIRAGGFGMVFFSPRLVRALEPIRTWDYMDGIARVEKFCSNDTQTEDHDLCERATAKGFRICADTRLVTEHHKTMPILSYRAWSDRPKQEPSIGPK